MSENEPLNREMRRHPEKMIEPSATAPDIPPMDVPKMDTENAGAGAGGLTEFGGGNKNHPSRIASSTPAGERK